jgi:metal-sulfur cluster biosynthetic enzyme
MSETRYEERTDNIETKLRLLQQACAGGHHDLTMSLIESLKDTVIFERQRQPGPQQPVIRAEEFIEVAALPPAWAQWAQGWKFCKVVELSEEAGIERCREPVDIHLAFTEEHCTDLQRELRVARLDEESGTVREVVSQLCGEVCQAGERRCRLVFMADVPAQSRARYLILYGNPLAELPRYATDLQVQGEGYGLDIENEFYAARLSRQMGQMESLRYKRTHGLELSAASYYDGVGHGEPANIDWGHDYYASNRYQKFRVTNWAECPNYEVVKGPLCVQVRRWGFPHSAIHPLFAPSRMHIDVQYTFYAGLPFFIKEGRMEMVQDFEMNYLRDDEWVIAGHPFTQTVWMDQDGILHEGKVEEGHHNDLWGVGFFHEHSRESFIALFLEHSAENFDGIRHCGSPGIDGVGPGLRTIWSRAATVENAQFQPGVALKQRNAYLLEPYEGPAQVQEIRKRMMAPLQVCAGTLPSGAYSAAGQLARAGETAETAPLKETIWAALREVVDQQLIEAAANIVDMGYVYDVRVEDDLVWVLVTMPHRGRPMYEFIGKPLRERLLQVDGVREVVVDFTWEPGWDVGRLTARGRELLGM